MQTNYLAAIQKELAMVGEAGPFSTIFLGGGSPSAMQRTLLYSMLDWISAMAEKGAEWTIEVNPGQTDAGIFEQLRQRGVNRISIGAQSFQDRELEFLGRIHNRADIIRCFEQAHAAGFENVGLDLIFAIPGSTIDSWKASLEQAIGLGPEHLSAYSLTYEGDTPLVRAVAAGETQPVSEELDGQMYELTIATCEAAGYGQYEISNFARPGRECRHNLRYWQNRPYVGLGPAAASWYQGKRSENVADLAGYLATIGKGRLAYESSQQPSSEELACQTAVLNLRMRTGIEPVEFTRQTGYDIQTLFAGPIAEHLACGHLEWHEGRLRLSRKAVAIADRIVCDFATP